MGEDVDSRNFTRQDRQWYRAKLRRCLDVFAQMLAEARFDFDRPLTGLRSSSISSLPSRIRQCATPTCSPRSPTKP
jgi:hypothetical protein